MNYLYDKIGQIIAPQMKFSQPLESCLHKRSQATQSTARSGQEEACEGQGSGEGPREGCHQTTRSLRAVWWDSVFQRAWFESFGHSRGGLAIKGERQPGTPWIHGDLCHHQSSSCVKIRQRFCFMDIHHNPLSICRFTSGSLGITFVWRFECVSQLGFDDKLFRHT